MKNLMDKLASLKAEKAELDGKVKELSKEIETTEYAIMQEMEKVGAKELKNEYGAFKVKPQLLPKITDMVALVKFMADNDRPELLQKRASSTAVTEFFETEGYYPEGVEVHITNKLSFTKPRGGK